MRTKLRRLLVLTASSAFLFSCATHPQYLTNADIPDGAALPIDGEWVNSGGLRCRISHGKLFTLNRSSNGALPGTVFAKNIQPNHTGWYACKTESHNQRTKKVSYGDGSLIITSLDTLVLAPASNLETGLLHPRPVVFEKISIDREDLYLAEFSAVTNAIFSRTNIVDLVSVAALPEIRGSTVASLAMNAVTTVLEQGWETISQDDYKRNFTAPDGSFLPDLMDQIRQKRHLPPNESLSVSFNVGQQSTSTVIQTTVAKDGVIQLSFASDGIDYRRSEYYNNLLVHETITRGREGQGPKVDTEVYHFDGVIYRVSRVIGL